MRDQGGNAFDFADYRGKTLLVGFMFTRCSGACPLQCARMASIQAKLAGPVRERSRMLSISIDPAHDSGAALAAYADGFRADPGFWRFGAARDGDALTGLLGKLGVSVVDKDGAPDHKMAVLLLDPDGRILQRYVGDRMDAARVANEIATADRLFGRKRK